MRIENPTPIQVLKEIRRWCIPGMDWSDDVGKALLAEFDKAIAELGQMVTLVPHQWPDSPLPFVLSADWDERIRELNFTTTIKNGW